MTLTNRELQEMAKLRNWMWANSERFVDPKTGEINYTKLAEAAAIEFECSDVLGDPDHWIWELAVESAENSKNG